MCQWFCSSKLMIEVVVLNQTRNTFLCNLTLSFLFLIPFVVSKLMGVVFIVMVSIGGF